MSSAADARAAVRQYPSQVVVPNVAREERVKFYGIPKLGAFVALAVRYESALHHEGVGAPLPEPEPEPVPEPEPEPVAEDAEAVEGAEAADAPPPDATPVPDAADAPPRQPKATAPPASLFFLLARRDSHEPNSSSSQEKPPRLSGATRAQARREVHRLPHHGPLRSLVHFKAASGGGYARVCARKVARREKTPKRLLFSHTHTRARETRRTRAGRRRRLLSARSGLLRWLWRTRARTQTRGARRPCCAKTPWK